MTIRSFLLAAALVLLSSASHAESIKDIIDNPRSYVDRTVVVEGRVVSAFSLVLVKYFTVSDGAASISVFTTQPLPRKGENIRVVGRVHELFSFGSDSLLVLVEQKSGAEGPPGMI